MTSLNFPDLIGEKIAWYYWKYFIKETTTRTGFPYLGMPAHDDILLVVKMTGDHITRSDVVIALHKFNHDIVSAIIFLTPPIPFDKSRPIDGQQKTPCIPDHLQDLYQSVQLSPYYAIITPKP